MYMRGDLAVHCVLSSEVLVNVHNPFPQATAYFDESM